MPGVRSADSPGLWVLILKRVVKLLKGVMLANMLKLNWKSFIYLFHMISGV